MTGFEKYLGTLLLNSGEDCCSKCAYSPPTNIDDVCDNAKSETGCNDEVCLRGLKDYAEEHGFIAKYNRE